MSNELNALIQSERAALSLEGFRKAVVQGYVTTGGNLMVAKQIVIMKANEFALQALEEADLPGPDSLKPLLVPKLTEIVSNLAAKLFDDLVR